MKTSTRTLQISGFTLVELLIVVVLIGIVAALGIPRLSGYAEASRLDRARDQVVADLIHARMRAVSGGHQVGLCFLSGTEYVIVRNLTDPSTCNGDSVLKRVRLQQDYRGVLVSVSGSSTASFTFDSRGLSRNASTKQVNAQLGGRVRSFRVTPIGTIQHQ